MSLKEMEVDGEIVKYVEEEFVKGVDKFGKPIKESARYIVKEVYEDNKPVKCMAAKHIPYPGKGMALVDVDCNTGKTIELSKEELKKRSEDTKKMLQQEVENRTGRERIDFTGVKK